ncbi:probable threonine protease PRSS50 [Pteropus vampyrus]|uniref:Probable threonine protease PRSS50 n=1 Tax=Pteropus vampyrus TaxID=132908 RepID=A0A6P6BMR4_PTEVA|nr:probable threonine protease PRSS50 [Pteropus vampyrus]
MSYEFDPTLRDPASKVRRWPWMVSVQANGTHICAGALIASRWVLTVAHCLTQDDVIYSVRVGSPWINQTAQTASDVPVRRLIVNSRFQSRRYWSWVGKANNIGLLQLERSLKYSEYVWPICLPGLDYELKDYSVCTVMGWGLPRVDGELGQRTWAQAGGCQGQTFLRHHPQGPSVRDLPIRLVSVLFLCPFPQEISGEPLACPVENTWYLVGMVTWGPGCKHSEAPPIYLRVSAYQPWIWDSISGQALPALSRALLLALPLPLGLLAAR